MTPYPPGVVQYDIRLDFGKLSSRITRMRELRRCLPGVSSEFGEIVTPNATWKCSVTPLIVDIFVYLDGVVTDIAI